ncbi:hypothetical protein [Brasilonema sp. UFV-L1]|uniref:hypothetical protein n=1 Tax=Brasilonema sp. UFV-L1 TaxID=2234130 RepID=UPI00145F4328|nr:hypothetical protein [Brasilonema sp. UFV-L1]NMG05766.1 hypothetical protein [Brasilonema sp. UFV-L1]
MSAFKISDLSYFETDLPCNRQVQGGLSLSRYSYLLSLLSPTYKNGLTQEVESVTESDETSYYSDEETGSVGTLVLKRTNTGMVVSGTEQGSFGNSKYSSAFSIAASI